MKNKTFVAALCLQALPAWGLAQSFLLQGPPVDGKGRITLRYFWPLPDPETDSGPDILPGLYDLSAAYRLGERLYLVAALPYIRYRGSYGNWKQEKITRCDSGLGGISVALQYLLDRDEDRSTAVTAGVVLPTFSGAKEDHWDHEVLSHVGIVADFPEFYKSLDATTPFVRVSHTKSMKGGWRAGLEGGAFVMMARGGGTRPLYAQAGVSIGRSAGPIDLTAKWSGSAHVLGFVDEYYFHLYHQAGIGASWGRGRLRPGIVYTMFLDRARREDSRGAFGIRLSHEF